MGINQESISIQLPKNGIDENSHKKNKLERTNTFTLKLKAKSKKKINKFLVNKRNIFCNIILYFYNNFRTVDTK